MSIEYANDFQFWENDIADSSMPELPPEEIELIVEMSNDPIDGAKALQAYADSQSPEARKHILQKGVDHLNYVYTAQFLNSLTQINVEDEFDAQDPNQIGDMMELLLELRGKGDARVGGKLGFFEKHDYRDTKTGVIRPAIALRMHSGAFFKHTEGGGEVVGIPNYITIPVTAVSSYQIEGRE